MSTWNHKKHRSCSKGGSRSGGGGGGGGTKYGAADVKWANPSGGPLSELSVVSVDRVISDLKKNGFYDGVRPERVKAWENRILEAISSGNPVNAPELGFFAKDNPYGVDPGYRVNDGRHRIIAYQNLGFKTIKALVDK